MTARANDLTGRVFGLLTALRPVGTNENRAVDWLCRCDCSLGVSKEVVVDGRSLTRGSTRSCGCYRKETSRRVHTTHGRCYSSLYNIWVAIKKRTRSKKDRRYKDYGARGITMCDEWYDSFEVFAKAVQEPPHPGMTLDRIDNNKGYFPGNVRWATATQQARNRRGNRRIEYHGETLTMAEWAERFHLDYGVLKMRFRNKWSVEKAFTTPTREHKKAPRHFGREAEDFVTA